MTLHASRIVQTIPLLALLTTMACTETPSDEASETSEAPLTSDPLTGLEEGSVEAAGILRAANQLTAEELGYCSPGVACDHLHHVFLGSSASGAILAYRAGGDAIAGTADDRTFSDLATLRAATAQPNTSDLFTFQSLLRYALRAGWVYPYSVDEIRALREGTAEAAGILRAVNTIDEAQRGFGPSGKTFAYVDYWPNAAIADYRAGADGVAGTADDRSFATLSELRAAALNRTVLDHLVTAQEDDAIATYTLAQLLRMARQNGWTPPSRPWLAGWDTSESAHYIAEFTGSELPYSSGAHRTWYCHYYPGKGLISCGTSTFTSYLTSVQALVGNDGRFSVVDARCGSTISGSISANLHATLDAIRFVDCDPHYGYGGEHRETEPMASRRTYRACWHDGIVFPNGDWVDGYWVACP